VWQLLACAKPCCCYTWPACRYLYLCCPAWQLVDCVSVLVEWYVSTLINEDYYYYYYYCWCLCMLLWFFPVFIVLFFFSLDGQFSL